MPQNQWLMASLDGMPRFTEGEVAPVLSRLRRDRRITLDELALRVGRKLGRPKLTSSTTSRWLRGQVEISLSELQAILDVLKVDVGELLDELGSSLGERAQRDLERERYRAGLRMAREAIDSALLGDAIAEEQRTEPREFEVAPSARGSTRSDAKPRRQSHTRR